jgi:coenzyme F420 hydrogenase subunit beta
LCTGRGFDLARETAPDAGPRERADLGPVRAVLSGHATDPETRFRAATGGVASTLLAGALETGLADLALVAPPPERGWLAEARLVDNAAEVLASSGSWYLPVALEAAIRLARREGARLAVVGLPCHLQAWRRAASIDPRIGGALAMTVGLFCDHLVDWRFWQLLARLADVPADKIAAVRFRGEGWPGAVRFTLEDGSVRSIPYRDSLRRVLWKSYVFTPRRCLLCQDALSECADVSAGDAWLPAFAGDDKGTNALVVRTPRGEDLVNRLVARGRLAVSPMDPGELVRSQRVQLLMKKRLVGARFRLARLAGGEVPVVGAALPAPGLKGYALGMAALSASGLSRARWFEGLAPRIPWRVLARLLLGKRSA